MEKQIASYKKGILAFLVFQMAFWLISCAEIQQSRRYDELKNFKTLSIKELYPEALDKAFEWQPDAYLYSSTIQIRHIEDSSPLRIYFVFRSISSPNQYLLLYMIESETGFDFEIEAGEYQTEKSLSTSVNPDNITLDTFDAFEIAFKNGGQAYFERFQHPDMPLFIDIQPSSEFHNGTYWSASFFDINSNDLHIFIDDKDRNVFEVREFYTDD